MAAASDVSLDQRSDKTIEVKSDDTSSTGSETPIAPGDSWMPPAFREARAAIASEVGPRAEILEEMITTAYYTSMLPVLMKLARNGFGDLTIAGVIAGGCYNKKFLDFMTKATNGTGYLSAADFHAACDLFLLRLNAGNASHKAHKQAAFHARQASSSDAPGVAPAPQGDGTNPVGRGGYQGGRGGYQGGRGGYQGGRGRGQS